jgi:hypothetical protein
MSAPGEKPTWLRPRFGMVLTILTAALVVFVLVNDLLTGDVLGTLVHTGGLALLVFAVWLLFWAPAVGIRDDAVIVDNPLRRITIPWAAIERVDTRWSLRIFTAGRAVTAWSAPAPSRYAMMRVSKSELKGLPESTYGPGHSVGLGDMPESESGLAAYYVRRRYEALRDDGSLGETTPVVAEWRWTRIAVLLALTAVTIAGFVVR